MVVRDPISDGKRPPPRLRFGLFELDLSANELTRAGKRVDIQGQPLRVIAVLARKQGEVVTREEMQQQIWADQTYVDFEAGLRTALRKARQALGDDAANPRFIETLPRQGYRFIAPVSFVMPAVPGQGAAGPTEEVESGPEAPVSGPEAPVGKPPPVTALPRPSVDEPLAPPVQRSPRGRRVGVWIAASVVLLGAAGTWLWYVSRPKPPVFNHLRLFAASGGRQNRPAFSPNGEYLAFDWKGPHDDRTSVYIQKLDAPEPVRLTSGASEDFRPVWSGDGSQVAFLRAEADRYSIYSIALVDRRERHWVDFSKALPWFDWSVDGKWFAVAEPAGPAHVTAITLISTDSRRRTITSPPAAWNGDNQPVFSPDGRHIAFRRVTAAFGHEDIYVVPAGGGQPERWTFDDRSIGGFTFMPSGGLLFSSQREGTLRSLWWVGPKEHDVAQITPGTAAANMPAVSRNGKRFAFIRVVYDVNVWRIATAGDPAPRSLIDSPTPDGAARLSPDGRRIAFQSDRSGNIEIWVCDADGANAVRLTNARGEELGNPEWSPDGTRIAFEWHRDATGGIYTVSPGGGGLQPVAVDSNQYRMPAWTHDGRSIYSVVTRSGHEEIWKASVQGGAAVPVAHLAGRAARESPDGKYLFFFRAGEVWRVPLSHDTPAQAPAKILDGLHPQADWGNWDVSDSGIYYIHRREQENATIDYLAFDHQSVRTLYVMPRLPVYGERGLALSADGKFLLFSQVDQNENQIFMQ